MLKTLKMKKGLTLIELIAVLVILGIIAAIAIPTIGNTINNQKERAANAEWSNILSSAELYAFQANPQETAFAMDDLFGDDYISENVVLSDDDGVIVSTTDIFEYDGIEVTIAVAVTVVLIDGFTVYGTPA